MPQDSTTKRIITYKLNGHDREAVEQVFVFMTDWLTRAATANYELAAKDPSRGGLLLHINYALAYEKAAKVLSEVEIIS